MKIQAAVAWEAGATLSIEEFDLDDPRDDKILVKVEAAGVCHTDDNARLGRVPVVFPIILGHEGSGTVERTGRNVTKVKPGDKVLFTPDYCGRCEHVSVMSFRLPFHHLHLDHALAANQSHTCRGDARDSQSNFS